MDLILHVGLYKTATTTLQKTVFSPHPACFTSRSILTEEGYDLADILGHKDRDPISDNESRAFYAKKWAETLMASVKNANNPLPKSIVVSEEALSNWQANGQSDPLPISMSSVRRSILPRKRPNPLALFLAKNKEEFWPYGDVKILLTVRNQVDWLASLYAQLSDRIVFASQSDFEARTSELLDSGDPYIFWSCWIHDFSAAVGKDNVSVLLSEEMDKAEFWDSLLEFSGLSGVAIEDAMKSSSRPLNRRRDHGTGRWRLRSFNARRSLKINTRFSDAALKRGSFAYQVPVRLVLYPFRGRFIHLTDQHRKRILDRLDASNQVLEAILNKPLDKYGYL